jgi:hypothetical protein
MAQQQIAVLEFQQRATRTEYLRWIKVYEDTHREYEELSESDPKVPHLLKLCDKSRILYTHYDVQSTQQEATLAELRQLN